MNGDDENSKKEMRRMQDSIRDLQQEVKRLLKKHEILDTSLIHWTPS